MEEWHFSRYAFLPNLSLSINLNLEWLVLSSESLLWIFSVNFFLISFLNDYFFVFLRVSTVQSNWSCAEIFLTLLVIVLGMLWVICCWITLEANQDLLESITLWNNISWLYSILSCIGQHPVSKRIPMFDVEVGNRRRIFRHLHCIISNLCISD